MKNIFKLRKQMILLTVCKSRRNKIKAMNPDPIPKGAKLIIANNLPKKSPEIAK